MGRKGEGRQKLGKSKEYSVGRFKQRESDLKSILFFFGTQALYFFSVYKCLVLLKMFSQFRLAEPGFVKEPDAKVGIACGTSGSVSIETLTDNKRVTLFGRSVELKAGTQVLIKKSQLIFSLDGVDILNTQEWEATFQNKAAQAGLAPAIYGFDNVLNVVVMAPLAQTLKEKIGQTGEFTIDDQCQYVALMHELDKIGIYHNDYKLDNFMFDSNGILYAIDFGIAKPIDQAKMFTDGFSPNVTNCRARLSKSRSKKIKGRPTIEGRAYTGKSTNKQFLDVINSTVFHAKRLAECQQRFLDNKDPTDGEDEDEAKERLLELGFAKQQINEIGPMETFEFVKRGLALRKVINSNVEENKNVEDA